MNDAYGNQSTYGLCALLAISDRAGDFDTVEEIIDVLRARHSGVQEAVMQWARTGNLEDLVPVTIKASLAAADAASHEVRPSGETSSQLPSLQPRARSAGAVDLDGVRPALGDLAVSALDQVSPQCGGKAMDTRDVLVAMMTIDVNAERWQRIWLRFGYPEAVLAAPVTDPLQYSGDLWFGQPVTKTCAIAIRAALIMGEHSDLLPVPTGLLALCLIGERTTAASHALLGNDYSRYEELLELVQQDLFGSSWSDVGSVLEMCFSAAAAEPEISDEEEEELDQFASKLADEITEHYARLVDAVNEFLRADSPTALGPLIEAHPELLSDQTDAVFAKCIEDARTAGDETGLRNLEYHRRFLDNYRRLAETDSDRPGGGERIAGECPYGQHTWEGSELREPGYEATAMRCATCHVGHLMEAQAMPDETVQINYYIFPAEGSEMVGQMVKMWAIATCEGTIREMESNGVPVRRGTPVIGRRPTALDRHTDFRPLQG